MPRWQKFMKDGERRTINIAAWFKATIWNVQRANWSRKLCGRMFYYRHSVNRTCADDTAAELLHQTSLMFFLVIRPVGSSIKPSCCRTETRKWFYSVNTAKIKWTKFPRCSSSAAALCQKNNRKTREWMRLCQAAADYVDVLRHHHNCFGLGFQCWCSAGSEFVPNVNFVKAKLCFTHKCRVLSRCHVFLPLARWPLWQTPAPQGPRTGLTEGEWKSDTLKAKLYVCIKTTE